MDDSPKVPEPMMSGDDWQDLRRGAELFNAGRFWHAHEAWEEVWMRMRDQPAQSFFKGLIQLTAAHHQRTRGRYDGMLIHFGRARSKLRPFSPAFLGVAVEPLLASLDAAQLEATRLGRDGLEGFDPHLVPRIRVVAPGGAGD